MTSKNCIIAYQVANFLLANELENYLKENNVSNKMIAIYDNENEKNLVQQLSSFSNSTILFLISDNFIKSENCMSDFLNLLQHNHSNNIFVIADGTAVTENGNTINFPTAFEKIKNVIEYLNFWQNKYLEVRKLKSDKVAANRLEKIKNIAAEVGDVLRFLRSVEHYPFEQIANNGGQVLLKLLKSNGISPQISNESPKENIPSVNYEHLNHEEKELLQDSESEMEEEFLTNLPGWDLLQSKVADSDNYEISEHFEKSENESIEEEVTYFQPNDYEISPQSDEEIIIEAPKQIEISTEKPTNIATNPANIRFNHPILDQAFYDAESGNVAKAIEDVDLYLETNKQDISARYHYALLLARFQNNLLGAKKQLTQVLEYDKYNVKTYYLLGELGEIEKDYKNAIDNFEKVAILDKQFKDIQLKLGKLYVAHSKGNHKKAVKHLKFALLNDPENSEIYYLLGTIQYEHFGKHKKAIRYFHQTLSFEPKHPFAYYDLANVYLDLNEFELAEKYYLKSIINNPELRTLDNDNVFNAYKINKFYKKPTYKGTILITGATSGIGKATANLFAKNGYRLILTGRRKEKLDIMRLELESNYECKVLKLPFDITSTEQIDYAIDNLPEDWKKIDILLNNAGKAKGLDSIQEGNWDHWQEMIDTNVKGLLYITRKISPLMVERNHGHIINISSSAGKEVYSNGAVYCATKHAVEALTKGMRLDLYKHNIRVSQVSPGHVEETEFALTRFDGDTEKAKIYNDFQPLKSSDVAEAILYIVSQPAHVNVQDVVLFSTQQANSTNINRNGRKD
jgi:NADP-dependent 3-hydroxy acid dehydrogenase YdfG/Tfp pilus assembly protein PilF